MLRFIYCLIIFGLFHNNISMAQEKQDDKTFTYRVLPEAPQDYTPGNIASRMLDGLGFRFFWATHGLRPDDFNYRPSKESRSIEETIAHIYDLTYLVLITINEEDNMPQVEYEVNDKRSITLDNIKRISDVLRNSSQEDFNNYTLTYPNDTTIPFWNMINGPIADAIWHCGQIASMRRISGNPFNPNLSLMTGKERAATK